MENHPDHNLRHEARAVEEGHRAILDRSGFAPRLRVVSDTKPGKHYQVSALATASGQGVSFVCRPIGEHAYEDDHLLVHSPEPGLAPCKHAALAARRLAREGFVSLAFPYAGDRSIGSLWLATIKAERLLAAHARSAGDPFAGFPR